MATSNETLYGRYLSEIEFRAPALQELDKGNGLAIEGSVFSRRAGSQMRLERHVAQVFELHDPDGSE